MPGRSAELAADLGGHALCLFPPGRRRPPVLVRWAVSAVVTVAHVVRHRPVAVVVTNPPCPAGVIGWAAARLVGARFVLDSHPGSFGAQGDQVAAALQPVNRRLTRRADLCLVAAPEWAAVAESWGARALVVHEAPGDWQLVPLRRHGRLRVLYVGRFARDEPWQAVLDAATAMPEVDVALTGDPVGVGLDAGTVAPNVSLLGYLGPDDYRRAVYDADVVVTLTTEPGSVMRAACEAVWAGRPVVVSDWPAGRDAFPFAVRVANDGEALAEGLRQVAAGYDGFAARTVDARRLQAARWDAQRAALAAHLGLDPVDDGVAGVPRPVPDA